MAKVLVLGGAGFIGFHLVRRLAEQQSDQITLVDDLSRGQLDQELERFLAANPQINLVTGDLSKPETFDKLGGPFDQVYLLAGVVGVRNVETQSARVLYINTNIVMNAVEWAKRVGCGRMLYASTSEAYGASVELGYGAIPTAEDVPVGVIDVQHPRSTYAISKMLGEATITHYSKTFDFEAVIVRYHNVYGPRMGMDHVIPEVMDRLSSGMNPLPVYGQDQTRAFCYVSDAVAASQALMTCPITTPELVHIGNDHEISINSLLEKMLKVTGLNPDLEWLPAPSGGVSRRCPDISKLRKLTGFEPAVPIESGLSHTWEWYGHGVRQR